MPIADTLILSFLQTLVTSKPPARWMRYRQRMNEVKEQLATDLSALFAEYNHLAEEPLLQEISELWHECS